MTDDRPWRIVTGDGRRPVEFGSEIGARTAAALRIARAGRAAARVEHRDDDGPGWHACPGGEELHGHGEPRRRTVAEAIAAERLAEGRRTRARASAAMVAANRANLAKARARLSVGRRDRPDPDHG